MTALRTWAFSAALILMAIRACCAEDQTITLEHGTSFPLVFEIPFDTVLIENPDVVNVHSHVDLSVTLEGIGLGTSNLVFVYSKGIVIANVRVVVCDVGATRTGD